jgi:cyanophycin synthetase
VAERVRAGGRLVLNADDPESLRLVDVPRVMRVRKEVVLYSTHARHLAVVRHLAAGGTAYFVDDGWLVEATSSVRRRIARVTAIPATMSGAARFNVSNALAAVASCRGLGLGIRAIARGLATFDASTSNPGRANVYRAGRGFVVLDYGHNPGAFDALGQMAAHWPGRRVTGVITVPGDRADSVVRAAGEAAVRAFHTVVIREDKDLRGRAPGEIAQLLFDVIQPRLGRECTIVRDGREAMRSALEAMSDGDVVVLLYEHLEDAWSELEPFGPVPVSAIPPLRNTRSAASSEGPTRVAR